MKKIVKSLSLLALLPVLSLGVTSCGSSKVKDVKTAASKVSESIAATPTVYKQKAEKADFFSLKAAASVNVDEQIYDSNSSMTAQLVVNPDFFVELTKEEPNINNLTLVDSMYFNSKSYATDGESEDTTFIEVGVYDDVAYGHTKFESTGYETEEIKEKFVGVNDYIVSLIKEYLPPIITTEDAISTPIDNDVLTALDAFGPATLAWLSEEITSETYVDTIGQLIISTDPEAATQFNALKPLITNIADIARTNINTLFEIKGDERSFSITNDTSKTKAFLNSLATYANEQAAKTEGTEAMLAPFYGQIGTMLTEAAKEVPTYSVTLSLSFKDKAIVGFGFDYSFSDETTTTKANFSFEVLFEKIKVEQMTGLDQYIIPEFE
ncbi:MAG: hypothetical protein ACI318_01705 [Bacilli bacterium]